MSLHQWICISGPVRVTCRDGTEVARGWASEISTASPMRPEWTEHIHPNTHTRTHTRKQHKMTGLQCHLSQPQPHLVVPSLSLSLSLDPAFTHLHSSSWCLRTGETQKVSYLTAFLCLSCPLWSSSFLFLVHLLIRNRSTCEFEHRRRDDRYVLGSFCLSFFSLFHRSKAQKYY